MYELEITLIFIINASLLWKGNITFIRRFFLTILNTLFIFNQREFEKRVLFIREQAMAFILINILVNWIFAISFFLDTRCIPRHERK